MKPESTMPPNSEATEFLRQLANREAGNVPSAQVAVLAERVDTLIGGLAKQDGKIDTISLAVAQMGVFQEKLAAGEAKFSRLFEMSDSFNSRLATVESEIKSTNRIARLGLFAAPFFIAALVWAHAELISLRARDAEQASRLTLLEFVNNGVAKPSSPLVMPPSTSTGK